MIYLDAASRVPLEKTGVLPFQASAMADYCIVSDINLCFAIAPESAFTLSELPGVAVVVDLADGQKCERCWKVLPDVGSHKHPGTCARCDAALG